MEFNFWTSIRPTKSSIKTTAQIKNNVGIIKSTIWYRKPKIILNQRDGNKIENKVPADNTIPKRLRLRMYLVKFILTFDLIGYRLLKKDKSVSQDQNTKK